MKLALLEMVESMQDYDVSRQSAASVLQTMEHRKLALVKETSSNKAWKPILEDHTRRSFSYILRQSDNTSIPAERLHSWFKQLHPDNYVVGGFGVSTSSTAGTISWTDAKDLGTPLLRKTAWCTLKEGCTCNYEYSDTSQGRVTDEKMMSVVKDITRSVVRVTGLEEGALNSANLNYYPAGAGVGFHADDEPIFDGLARDTAIVSLSLCEGDGKDGFGSRRFEVRLKRAFLDGAVRGEEPRNEEIVPVELRHGDIMTMEGLHQLFYLHSVWPGDVVARALETPLEDGVGHNVKGARINLTWRRIASHGDSCPFSAKRARIEGAGTRAK